MPGRYRLGHGHPTSTTDPLSNGATTVQVRGNAELSCSGEALGPDRTPRGYRIYYSAPTVIRAFMKQGTRVHREGRPLFASVVATVGGPINPRAWEWYHENIGKSEVPDRGHLVADGDGRHHDRAPPRSHYDEAWQRHKALPRHLRRHLRRGRQPDRGRRQGQPGHHQAVARYAPDNLKDPQRFREKNGRRLGDKYFVEDGAERDEDGYYTITGRIDDVMNVSGHRIGTMRRERARLPQVRGRVSRHWERGRGQGPGHSGIRDPEGDTEGSEELSGSSTTRSRRP